MYTVSNISAVVELSRVERRARLRARWPQTRGGRKLGRPAYNGAKIPKRPTGEEEKKESKG